MGESLTLSEVCEELVDCVNRTAPETDNGEYFAVGTPAMRGNTIDFSQARRISSETFARWTRRLVPKEGDLLLAREAPVGPVVRIPAGENIAAGQRTMHLRADPSIVHPRYLFYLLVSPEVQNRISVLSMGSTVAHLRVADAKALTLPRLPSLPEQRAIAEVLGALDDKIAANDKVVRLSDEMAEAIVLSNFNGKTDSLSTIALITMGSSPPGTSYNESSEGVPFYQGVRDFGVRFPTRRIWTNAPVRMAEANDTLVSVRAPVGETNIANEAMCIGRGIASLRSLRNRPMTLFHQIRAAKSEWAPYQAEGTVFGSINKNQIESISVPAISEDVAENLEKEVGALEARISAALKENQKLATTRDTLLPLLMSGKVRVRDAEKVVEEVV